MKISDIIGGGGRPFPSIEIVPPLKGVTKNELVESIRPFMEFNPPYVNVTSHRDEVEYAENGDGTFTRRSVRRRVSETAVCAAIQSAYDIEVVPHVICAGASKDRIDDLLHDFEFLGVDNVMALRGDCLVGEKRFTPEKDGYCYASELVEGIGAYAAKTGKQFCVGVGGYPEKHFEAANLDEDIQNLRLKVEAGADYIITQMFFDNKVFYSFRDKCRAAGITVPIIPGLKPLSTLRHLSLLPEAFSLDIPQELSAEMRAHKDECYRTGMEWCSAQCADLLAHDVPAVHFYTMGRSDNIVSILRDNF